jgi:hypothetical protein
MLAIGGVVILVLLALAWAGRTLISKEQSRVLAVIK